MSCLLLPRFEKRMDMSALYEDRERTNLHVLVFHLEVDGLKGVMDSNRVGHAWDYFFSEDERKYHVHFVYTARDNTCHVSVKPSHDPALRPLFVIADAELSFSKHEKRSGVRKVDQFAGDSCEFYGIRAGQLRKFMDTRGNLNFELALECYVYA